MWICRGRQGDDSGMDANGIVDQVLSGARDEINSKNMNQVDLPDIIETFRKKIGPIHVSGRFEARDGWAKSLSSLVRTGDAVMQETADKIIVEVPLGLSDLQVG